MHVVFGVERQVVVVNVLDAVDVQAARGNIGGHQDFQLALLEAVEQALALLLRHIAGEHADAVAGLLKRARHALHEHLGVDEHHGARAFAAREQAQQQRDLLFVGREVDALAHARGGDRFAFHHQLLRLVHVLIGQLQHAVAERGAEQQGLPGGALGHAAQQEADVLDEAQVEHAVGFVEHADFAGVQRDHLVLLDVIDQAARGGDDHVHALLQQFALLVVIHAAVDQRKAQAEVRAELHRILVDLDGQFAGGRQDQRARVFRLAVGQRRAGQQPVHHGHQERQRLAGTGLGLAGDIAAGQCHGQGQRLDRGAAGKTSAFKASLQGRMQLEGGEGQIGQRFVAHESVLVRPADRDAGGLQSWGAPSPLGPAPGKAEAGPNRSRGAAQWASLTQSGRQTGGGRRRPPCDAPTRRSATPSVAAFHGPHPQLNARIQRAGTARAPPAYRSRQPRQSAMTVTG